jgi:hypothetical protein
MTPADVQARLADFEERLATQSAERDKAQALLERMTIAVAQLQGAVTALRGLLANEPPPEGAA